MRDAVIDAVTRYGTQFSSSRAYLQSPQYNELEPLLDEMFGGHVLVTPTTSLGHLATLPVLVESTDAVLLDHQVHASVQMAANQLRVKGATVELIRHNNMERLEAMIQRLAQTHNKLWYMADGVYSMFADFAPFDELLELLDRYEQLHLYIDDSHGVGWAGKHGRGPALDAMGMHPRLIAACSLNKSFATAGGAIVFPNAEMEAQGPQHRRADDLLRPGPAAAARRRDRSRRRSTSPTSCRSCRPRCATASSSSPTSPTSSCIPLASRDVTPIRYIPLGLPAVTHDVLHARARGRPLHEPRHVPGRPDEALRRPRDADAASHRGRHPRAGRLARAPRPGRAGARWRGRQAPPRQDRRLGPDADARAPPLRRRRWTRPSGTACSASAARSPSTACSSSSAPSAARASGPRTSGASTTTSSATPSGVPCWPRSSRRRCGRTT